MRRTAGDAAKTKAALLNAALLVVQRDGWRGATFDRIAASAGVTRGALTHHFHDKRALLSEALGWGWSTYGGELFAVLERPIESHASHSVTQFVVAFSNLLVRDPTFSALVSATVTTPADLVAGREEKELALGDWQLRLARAMSPDLISPSASAEAAANAVMVYIQGLTVIAGTQSSALPQTSEIAVAVDCLVEGFNAKAKAEDGQTS